MHQRCFCYICFLFKALTLESMSLKDKLRLSRGQGHLPGYLKALSQLLKCCTSALSSYNSQLPFCTKVQFPPSVKTLAALVKSAAVEANRAMIEGADQLAMDADRLVQMAQTFDIGRDIGLVEKLAEQKFGRPHDIRKVTKVKMEDVAKKKKQKEIIPR